MRPGRSIRAQPKSSYQEWQRDRPDEATTTYRRRVGKVPSPGRTSCEIRELPFGAPSTHQSRRCPYPVPRPRPRLPERPMTTETLDPPTATTDPRIIGMRCRNCGHAEPIGLSYVCPACFGPLEVAYDYALIGRTLTREAVERRGPGIWRFAELLPVDAPPARGLAGRVDAADPRRPPGADARRRPAVDQGRHPQPVAQLQGPGGRGRGRPGGRVRRGGAVLRVDRQPRRRDGRGGGRDRPAGLRLHPGRPGARQGRPRPRLRRDGGPDRRAPTTT